MAVKGKKGYTPQYKAAIIARLAAGERVKEICEAEGMHPSAVYNWRKEAEKRGEWPPKKSGEIKNTVPPAGLHSEFLGREVVIKEGPRPQGTVVVPPGEGAVSGGWGWASPERLKAMAVEGLVPVEKARPPAGKGRRAGSGLRAAGGEKSGEKTGARLTDDSGEAMEGKAESATEGKAPKEEKQSPALRDAAGGERADNGGETAAAALRQLVGYRLVDVACHEGEVVLVCQRAEAARPVRLVVVGRYAAGMVKVLE